MLFVPAFLALITSAAAAGGWSERPNGRWGSWGSSSRGGPPGYKGRAPTGYNNPTISCTTGSTCTPSLKTYSKVYSSPVYVTVTTTVYKPSVATSSVESTYYTTSTVIVTGTTTSEYEDVETIPYTIETTTVTCSTIPWTITTSSLSTCTETTTIPYTTSTLSECTETTTVPTTWTTSTPCDETTVQTSTTTGTSYRTSTATSCSTTSSCATMTSNAPPSYGS